MSPFVTIVVSVLIGLFVLLSLLPSFFDRPDNDSVVHLHDNNF